MKNIAKLKLLGYNNLIFGDVLCCINFITVQKKKKRKKF